MNIAQLVAAFFAGAFLSNSIPHLAAGLRGEMFPTPFASPPGKGMSSPIVNALWGSGNLLAALVLASRAQLRLAFDPNGIAAIAGFVALACFTAVHFGRVRRS